MKVLVIGLGSMGKRRIRLINQIDSSISIVGIDSKVERHQEAQEKFSVTPAGSIKDAVDMMEGESVFCAIISTSPLSHAPLINECLMYGFNVFTELNLVNDGYEENMRLAAEKGLALFLSSTLLYREEVKYISNRVKKACSKINYCYHIGQYLPDWHPWEDYKSFFVGNKRTNGCREIFAIEFPWLIQTFGTIDDIKVNGGQMSGLTIGYPDNFQLLIKHKNGTLGMLAVDVVSRKAVRNLEIYGEDLYISWNGSPTGLEEFDILEGKSKAITLYENVDHQEGYSAFVVENAYKNELISFFELVRKGSESVYGFADDLKTLRIIDSVEGQVSSAGPSLKCKVLFIGVGSIARRHIRNLAAIQGNRSYRFKIDVLRSGNGNPLENDIGEIITDQFFSENEITERYDIAFITNPTAMHFQTIKKYAGIAKNMFIEKPVFDSTDYDVSGLGLQADGIYYVACPLRYTSVLQYVKSKLPCNSAIAVRSISSSFLPDWRPGTDYQTTYSAHKHMGGGVSIDLIHEWDYLTWLFGMPTLVHSVIGKYSSLGIDSDDSALYIGCNDTTTFELHLDYYGREPLRGMQIFLPDETVDVDLVRSSVRLLRSGEIVDQSEDRDSYQTRELEHFLDIVEGKTENDNDICHAFRVLKLARGN